MSAWTVRWVPGCAAAASVALIGAGLALAYVDRHLLPASLTNWTFSSVSGQVVNVAVPVTGFVLASRRPGNRIGWLFLVAGLALGLGVFSNPYAVHALVVDRGSLPAGRVFGWLSNWIWAIPFAMLAFLFLLFPTGLLRSRRWRPAAWFVGGAFAFAAAGALVIATSQWAHPFASSSPGNPASTARTRWGASRLSARAAPGRWFLASVTAPLRPTSPRSRRGPAKPEGNSVMTDAAINFYNHG